jgi:hypothetical protein
MIRRATCLKINFLLIAMLVHAGVDAWPIVYSTTDELPLNNVFPVLNRVQGMACAVKDGNSWILLDASDNNNCYNQLNADCYNGFAWIFGTTGTGVNLGADNIKDKTVYVVKLFDFTDSIAKLEISEKYGNLKSVALRKSWAKDDEHRKKFIADREQSAPSGVTFLKSTVENLDNPDTGLVIKYTAKLELDKNAATFFMNASWLHFFDENPFKATVRRLPVEFPNKSEFSYYMNVMLPKNMHPDTLAKPLELDYENGAMHYSRSEGYYEGINTIAVNVNFSISTTSYDTDYYESLRTFFQRVIEENNQVLTIRKTAK